MSGVAAVPVGTVYVMVVGAAPPKPTRPLLVAENWVKGRPSNTKLKGSATTSEDTLSEVAATSCVVPMVMSTALLLRSSANEPLAAVLKA